MTKEWELIVAGGRVVLPDRVVIADIGIKGGLITAVSDSLDRMLAEEVYDASGKFVMPGAIDVHVHLDEPGLGHWEGFKTGSAALAAGGCTTFIDMPLNGIPPTVTEEALRLKLKAAADSGSYVDYALWGGLVPGNAADLRPLAEAGVAGFKAFLSAPSDTGEGSFLNVDHRTLVEGMETIAAMDRILALHAESEPIVSRLAQSKKQAGAVTMRDYLESRPPEAETEAVRYALELAAKTGCSLHFVHISTPGAVRLITEAKRSGLDVSLETCPHYLAFTAEDAVRIGSEAKCSPPLRSAEEREEMWRLIAEDRIDMIASDHSPCPPELKAVPDGNYFGPWGGIAGAQHTLELMIGEGWKKRGIPLPQLAKLLSENPARRFGLRGRKGAIEQGLEADLVIIDTESSYVLSRDLLYYRHPHSLYEGFRFECKVAATLLRGKFVYEADAGPSGPMTGRWIKPDVSQTGTTRQFSSRSSAALSDRIIQT